MRHFDVASRDRDRVTLLELVSPVGNFTANASLAIGKDDYFESEFGLRDNNHHVVSSVGADYLPRDQVTLGAWYSYERDLSALSRSRQASDATQFVDPSRNWATDSADKAHSFLVNMGITRIAEKVDLHLAYDFSRTRAIYNYITGPVADRTLPEEVMVPSSLPTPTELPPTLSELQRATADVTYPLSARLSSGCPIGTNNTGCRTSRWISTPIPRSFEARRCSSATCISRVHSAHGLGTTRVSLVRALRTWGSCTFNLANSFWKGVDMARRLFIAVISVAIASGVTLAAQDAKQVEEGKKLLRGLQLQ